MQRMLLLALLALAVSSMTARAGDPWSSWIAEKKALLQVKDSGVKVTSTYRDQVCPLQKSEEQRFDCTALLNQIITRRLKEKQIISAMIAATNLPSESRDVLLEIVNPEYNRMNNETTDLAKEAFRIYPKRQARQ